MSHPVVSVIIPTFNRFTFLKEALNSVRAQTYPNIERIVVDDGSIDETAKIAADQDVLYLRMPHSGLPGRVRNVGAQRASGTLLAFLDSDDIWKPRKIERQVRFLNDNPNISICHTREIWKRGGRIVSQSGQRHRRSGYIFEECLKKCIIGPSTVVLARRLFMESGMFHPNLEIAEDYELWLRISTKHYIGYIDEPLVIKRGGHPDQLSGKYGQIEIFRIGALLEDIERGVFKEDHMQAARKELQKKCRIYARGCLKRGRTDEAAHYNELAKTCVIQ
jgi:glycosyltransferase involved in cell wall biosynthesis